MSTITDTPQVRKAETTGQKGRKQLKKIRDHAAPHVARVVAKAKRISRKAAEHIPEDTKRGFRDGRKAGSDLIEHVPYAAGAAAGFGYGVSEAIVGVITIPAKFLLGLGTGAVRTIQE